MLDHSYSSGLHFNISKLIMNNTLCMFYHNTKAKLRLAVPQLIKIMPLTVHLPLPLPLHKATVSADICEKSNAHAQEIQPRSWQSYC